MKYVINYYDAYIVMFKINFFGTFKYIYYFKVMNEEDS